MDMDAWIVALAGDLVYGDAFRKGLAVACMIALDPETRRRVAALCELVRAIDEVAR